MADRRTGDGADAGEPEGQPRLEVAVAAALQRITSETRELRLAAAASGRLLLAALTTWVDGEMRQAVTALNRDLPSAEDEDIDAAIAARLAGPGDPETLVDAMAEVLDAVGAVNGVDAVLWQRVRDLAGESFSASQRDLPPHGF